MTIGGTNARGVRSAGRRAVLIVACAACLAGQAHASFDTLISVAEPMEAPDCGCYTINYVTYRLMRTTIRMETVENMCRRGTIEWEDGTLQDRNVAHLAGITLRVDGNYDDEAAWKHAKVSRAPGVRPRWEDEWYVDTLRVILDVTAAESLQAVRMRTHARVEGFEYPENLPTVVKVTIDCIRDNAVRASPPVRWVRIKVLGSRPYRVWSGTYSAKRADLRREYAP